MKTDAPPQPEQRTKANNLSEFRHAYSYSGPTTPSLRARTRHRPAAVFLEERNIRGKAIMKVAVALSLFPPPFSPVHLPQSSRAPPPFLLLHYYFFRASMPFYT
jgi:hypothetical protein